MSILSESCLNLLIFWVRASIMRCTGNGDFRFCVSNCFMKCSKLLKGLQCVLQSVVIIPGQQAVEEFDVMPASGYSLEICLVQNTTYYHSVPAHSLCISLQIGCERMILCRIIMAKYQLTPVAPPSGPPRNPHTRCPSWCGRSPNAGLTLGQRRRRWPNVKPALGELVVSAEVDSPHAHKYDIWSNPRKTSHKMIRYSDW